jgi:hypothetical protein
MSGRPATSVSSGRRRDGRSIAITTASTVLVLGILVWIAPARIFSDPTEERSRRFLQRVIEAGRL